MADEWSMSELGRVVDIQTGKLDSNQADTDGTYPFFTCAPEPLRINHFAFDCDAILLAGNNANGVFHLNRYRGKFNAYQRTYVITPKASAAVDTSFLFYVLHTLTRQLGQYSQGTATKFLTMKTLSALPIPLPTTTEQRAIAYILGTLDDKIGLNRRMNETLEAMARAIFKSWFVSFDPVRAKAEGRDPGLPRPVADMFPDSFEDSELGEIPTGWSAGTLGDLCDRVVDKIDDPKDWQEEALIDLSRMPQKSIAFGDRGLGEELATSVTRFNAKDTLFGAIRPYFHKVGLAPMPGVTNISVFVLRAKKADDWPYVVLLASSSATVEYATRVSKGTKMPVVSWPDLQKYPVPVPPGHQRAAFGHVVAPKLTRVIANIHQSSTLAALRDMLLPKLISGEIRVKDAEKLAEANL